MSEAPVDIEEEVETGEKASLTKLQEITNGPNLNPQQRLDAFENEYINKLATYNPNDPHNTDLELTLFFSLPEMIISDQNFSEKIADIPNAADFRLERFPSEIREHIALDDNNEWGHRQFKKFPEDPSWSRYWELIQKYKEKVLGIVEKQPALLGDKFGDETERLDKFKRYLGSKIGDSYKFLLNEVKEKSAGKDLIASGEWLGSGTFLSDVERMLEYGGKIKSAYHVLNSGQKRSDMEGELKGGVAHRAFIFFFHLRNEDYGSWKDVVGRYGSVTPNLQRIQSDVSVFYPIDSLIGEGVSIGSYGGDKSMSEFFVTKSPRLINQGRRLSPDEVADIAKSDQTELPLSKAFFRVDDPDKYEAIKSLFSKFAYTEEWIRDHVFFEKPGSGRDVIRDWLKTRPYTHVQMSKYKPIKYFEDNFLWEPTN